MQRVGAESCLHRVEGALDATKHCRQTHARLGARDASNGRTRAEPAHLRNQRWRVRAGITGSCWPRLPSSTEATTSQVRHNPRARNAGSTRQVAEHRVQMKTTIRTVASCADSVAVPLSFRSR